MNVKKLAKLVLDIPYLSMFGYLPPLAVLNKFFSSNLKSMGLDESHAWRPFEISNELYSQLKTLTELKSVECSQLVTDIYSWQAWVYFVEKKVPFKEHLDHILAEKNALIELNRALMTKKDDLITQKHIDYIEAAENAMNFLRVYL